MIVPVSASAEGKGWGKRNKLWHIKTKKMSEEIRENIIEEK